MPLDSLLIRSPFRNRARAGTANVLPCLVSVLLLMGLLTQSGCSYFSKAEDDDAALAELEDEDTRRLSASGAGSSASGGNLALNLKVGDRFPLIKRVEQRLTQAVGTDVSVYRSATDLLMTLTVDEVRDGYKKLSVQYHRVGYSHDIGGKRVEYSSENRTQPVPPEALVYAGLKDNGFSFRIGPDNRIVELIGFPEFLQRCVRDVPPQLRQSVISQVEGTHSENDIANFIDEGIGILPVSDDPSNPNMQLAVGSAWELKPRRSEGPLPMHITTRCVLKDLNESSAEISLIGTIAGDQAPAIIRDADREMHVYLRGGHCSGTCRVDRKTGLPTNSQIKRYIELAVQLADGTQIQQRKETLTSISSFSDQGQTLLSGGTSAPSTPSTSTAAVPNVPASTNGSFSRNGFQSAVFTMPGASGSGSASTRSVAPAGGSIDSNSRDVPFGTRQ